MLLIFSKKKTPGTRFKKYLNKTNNLFFNKKLIRLKCRKLNHNLNKNNKGTRLFFRKKLTILSSLKTKLKNSGVIKTYFKSTNNKDFAHVVSIFGIIFFLNNKNLYFPGFLIFKNSGRYITFLNRELAGQILPIYLTPINVELSFINNKYNNKILYSKSNGSYSIRKKIQKKSKLILLQLPSKKIILISKKTLVCLAKNNLLSLNNLNDGKWGFIQKTFKKLTVRGVAKNPVDHPNGGRTKAKQPELSPWGWVAKHSK